MSCLPQKGERSHSSYSWIYCMCCYFSSFFFFFYKAVLHSHKKTPLSLLFNFVFICLLRLLALLHIVLCFIPLYLLPFSNQPHRPHTQISIEWEPFCTALPAPFAAVLFLTTSCFSSLSFRRCLHTTLLLLLYSPHHHQAQFPPSPTPVLASFSHFYVSALRSVFHPPTSVSLSFSVFLTGVYLLAGLATCSLARRCGASCLWGCGPSMLHVLLCVSGAHSLLLLQLCWMMAPLTLRSGAVMVI